MEIGSFVIISLELLSAFPIAPHLVLLFSFTAFTRDPQSLGTRCVLSHVELESYSHCSHA